MQPQAPSPLAPPPGREGADRRVLAEVAASEEVLGIEDEVLGPQRVAFRIWCTLPSGQRTIEHAILQLRAGQIARPRKIMKVLATCRLWRLRLPD